MLLPARDVYSKVHKGSCSSNVRNCPKGKTMQKLLDEHGNQDDPSMLMYHMNHIL
ncbi:hypothetical protein Lalb_Chr22g0351881 [Lupinus albus]|uniref:Uncharacterized protein n=1 Tax=Lupinus albus TaxID=3870 RepID=A0A6A4NN86_LUPAL|nr:hypothetical protein Lalb_Chr22g0351881 [Lupinus albus]